MKYLWIIAMLPWLSVPIRWLRARPEWGVAVGLVPSLFLTEDLHENFFAHADNQIITFHSLKLMGFLRPTEVIMAILTLVLFLSLRRDHEELRTPLGKLIIILLVLCPLAAIASILRGANPVNAFAYNSWRSFWWSLLFFYFCLWAIKGDRVEKTFAAFFVAIVLRMMFGVVKFFLGFGETHPRYPGMQIVFWDGLDMHLASALLVMSAVMLFDKRPPLSREWMILGLLLSLFIILFSLRRTPIANAVFAFVLLFLILPLKHKRRFIVGLLGVSVVVIALLSFVGGQGSSAPTEVVVQRVAEIFTLDLASVDEFHWFDPIDHFIAIMEKPIVGLGFGVPFQRTFLVREGESTFSHNAYLFVWGGMGIAGLLIYVSLYFRLLNYAREAFSSSHRLMIPALFSVILTGLAQGLYSTTNFTSSRMPFVLAFAMALIVKAGRVEALVTSGRETAPKFVKCSSRTEVQS